jgi:hypothetical protein
MKGAGTENMNHEGHEVLTMEFDCGGLLVIKGKGPERVRAFVEMNYVIAG